MNTHIDEAGLRVCADCGLVFERIDFTNECNWYNRDRTRCSRHWYPKPKGSAQKVIEAHHVEIPSMIRDVIENKYQHICKVEGKFAHGEYHVGIIAVCLFYVCEEMGVHGTSEYILNKFNITIHVFFQSVVKYMNAFPEARSYSITPTQLLPWMMKLAGIDQFHWESITEVCQLLENYSKRAYPQSVAGAVIYLYLCLNPEYMKQPGLTRESFAKKVQLTPYNVIKTAREMARNSFDERVVFL